MTDAGDGSSPPEALREHDGAPSDGAVSDGAVADGAVSDGPSRREALARMGQAALLGGGFVAGGLLLYDPEHPVRSRGISGRPLPGYQVTVRVGTPRVAVARGTDAVANVRAALGALGGIGQFIRPGDRVLLKPNAAFDRTPALGANTSPEVVGEVARLCRAAGAREVIVAEHTLYTAERCFASSGIGAAARRAGARIHIPSDSDFTEARIHGQVIDAWPVLKVLYRVDKVINLPTAKHHRLARASLGMKNWMGVLGGKRRRWHQKLAESVADLSRALRPTLVVLDASRLLLRHGPTGGRLSDVAPGHHIVAGWDQVAVDAQGAALLGAPVTEVGYITAAARLGLGRIHLSGPELAVIQTDG